MSTVINFAPTLNAVFQFQAILAGPTTNVTSLSAAASTTASSSYTVSVVWNVYRGGVPNAGWYVIITDVNNVLILCTPLVGSPSSYPISLIAGYFTSTLVFLEASNQFVVTT